MQAKKAGELTEETAQRILTELMEASETVTAFLTWAELEGASMQKNLFVVSVKKGCFRYQAPTGRKIPGQDFRVDREGFLRSSRAPAFRAYGHEPGDERAHALFRFVSLKSEFPNTLKITDHGSGIPATVIERLGDPFNKGEPKSASGHGLGLAYVQSVCKLYGWALKIDSSPSGTEIEISFPSLGEEPQAENHAERASVEA